MRGISYITFIILMFFMQVDCQHGYKHQRPNDADDFFWSLSSENDWVCQNSDVGSQVLTAQGVGIILNSVIFMQLSDS